MCPGSTEGTLSRSELPMSEVIEFIITGVYHTDSDSWDIWLTQSDRNSQFELVAFVDQSEVLISEQFVALRNRLVAASQW